MAGGPNVGSYSGIDPSTIFKRDQGLGDGGGGGAANPYPASDYSTNVKQDTGNSSLATIAGLLKLGTTPKATAASVTIATDQGNLEPGGTAITGAAMPTGGLGLTGWLSAIWSSVTSGAIYGVEAIAAQAANNTTAGVTRDAGASPSAWPYFGVAVFSTQIGTAVVETSGDATNWLTAGTVAMTTAGATYDLTVRVRNRYYRVKIINGATATTGTFVSYSFTKA